MKKRMDKKGEINWTVLVGGLIAVAVGLMAIWFFYDWISSARDIPGSLPTSLTVAAQACKLSVQQDNIVSYCFDFKEAKLAGKNQFINCEYIKSKYAEVDFDELTCDSDAAAKKYCEQLKTNEGTKYKGDDLVNGRPCFKAEAGKLEHWNINPPKTEPINYGIDVPADETETLPSKVDLIAECEGDLKTEPCLETAKFKKKASDGKEYYCCV